MSHENKIEAATKNDQRKTKGTGGREECKKLSIYIEENNEMCVDLVRGKLK